MVYLTWCLDYKRKKKSCFTLWATEKFKVALEMGRGWKSFPSHVFGHRLEVVPGLHLWGQHGLTLLCTTSESRGGRAGGTGHGGASCTPQQASSSSPPQGRGAAREAMPVDRWSPGTAAACSGSRAAAFGVT